MPDKPLAFKMYVSSGNTEEVVWSYKIMSDKPLWETLAKLGTFLRKNLSEKEYNA